MDILKQRYSGFWLFITALWVLILVGLGLAMYNSPQVAGDYRYYHAGAQRIIHDLPLYDNIDTSRDYVGPPLVIQMVLPFIARTDYATSVVIWYVINVISFLAAMWMITQTLTTPRLKLILWSGSLFFMPLWFSLGPGQVNPVMMVFIVGAWYTYRNGHKILPGVLLAIIVWTKFYPGLLIVYFLWKREWRVVISAGVATVLVLLFQMTLVGFDGMVQFFTEILPPLIAQGQPHLNHSNNSVTGFSQRLFSISRQVINIIDSPLLLALTRYSLMGLLLGSVAYLTAKPSVKMTRTPVARFDLEYALTLLVALLLGSTLGVHGMLNSLFAIAMVLNYTSHSRLRQILLALLVAVSLIDIHLVIIIGYLMPPSENTMPALALSMPFFGMLILWAATIMTLQQQIQKSELNPLAE